MKCWDSKAVRTAGGAVRPVRWTICRLRIGAYDERIEHQFLHRALEDLLLDALLDDQAVDRDRPLLPNAMRAILRLDVGLQSHIRWDQNPLLALHPAQSEACIQRAQQSNAHRRRATAVDELEPAGSNPSRRG